MEMEPTKNWEDLPFEIVVSILNILSAVDQLSMAHTCKKWMCALNFSNAWKFAPETQHEFDEAPGYELSLSNAALENAGSSVKTWSNLPPEILVKIFLNLTPMDRYAVCMTCKKWEEVFHCPVLWRSLTCIFSEDPPTQLIYKTVRTAAWSHGNNSSQIVHHCGPSLKCLWVYADDNQSFGVLDMIMKFFYSLTASNIQLDELHLTKFTKWELCRDTGEAVVIAIRKFLMSQEHLSVLRVNWSLPVAFGASMLEALSYKSQHTLKDLRFYGLSHELISVNRFYADFVTIWPQLVKLTLNYASISEEILISVCTTCKFTLKQLYIYFRKSNNRGSDLEVKVIPKIENHVWKNVKNLIPDLKVGIRLEKTTTLRNMEQVLSSEIPLAHLNIKKIFSDVCFRFLKAHFTTTLETLKLKNHTEDMVMTDEMTNLVTELVISASRLRKLTLTARVPYDTIENLCSLQERGKDGFDLHIRFWKPMEAEKRTLRQLQTTINCEKRSHKFYLSFIEDIS